MNIAPLISQMFFLSRLRDRFAHGQLAKLARRPSTLPRSSNTTNGNTTRSSPERFLAKEEEREGQCERNSGQHPTQSPEGVKCEEKEETEAGEWKGGNNANPDALISRTLTQKLFGLFLVLCEICTPYSSAAQQTHLNNSSSSSAGNTIEHASTDPTDNTALAVARFSSSLSSTPSLSTTLSHSSHLPYISRFSSPSLLV